jgi:drug/metabolite transporter (DMT)-like permease
MRHGTAFEPAAILLIEPALNPVWTWLLLGEEPGLLACIGGAILLFATIVNSWWQNRNPAAV